MATDRVAVEGIEISLRPVAAVPVEHGDLESCRVSAKREAEEGDLDRRQHEEEDEKRGVAGQLRQVLPHESRSRAGEPCFALLGLGSVRFVPVVGDLFLTLLCLPCQEPPDSLFLRVTKKKTDYVHSKIFEWGQAHEPAKSS